MKDRPDLTTRYYVLSSRFNIHQVIDKNYALIVKTFSIMDYPNPFDQAANYMAGLNNGIIKNPLEDLNNFKIIKGGSLVYEI